MMRKLTKLEKIGAVAAVIVIGSFLYLRYSYTPLERKTKGLNKSYQELSAKVKYLNAQWAGGRIQRDIRKLKKRLQHERESLEQAETCLVDDSETGKILNEIIAAVSKSGLMIKAYNPATDKEFKKSIRKNKENTYYERRYYKLVLCGKFSNFRFFLEEIIKLPRLVIVEQICFEKTKKGALTSTLLFSI